MYARPPQNLQELQANCQQLANKTIAQVASELSLQIPTESTHAKGWLGKLIENYLGADASSKALPDFTKLNIELKTIPVNHNISPLESTYVCTVQANEKAYYWRDSWVFKKLKQVLWVPIQGDRVTPYAERKILAPILWNMDSELESYLQTDWEELMELIQLGNAKTVSAKFGTYLHIRPKAANSNVLVTYNDINGSKTKLVPQGFYLRQAFTKIILEKYSTEHQL